MQKEPNSKRDKPDDGYCHKEDNLKGNDRAHVSGETENKLHQHIEGKLAWFVAYEPPKPPEGFTQAGVFERQ